jgi:hypothetical protein
MVRRVYPGLVFNGWSHLYKKDAETVMKLAITSIQRNRNPYIVEWIAFHLAMGFNQFYIYAHKTVDGMTDTLLRLSKKYPIQVFAIEMDDFPQIHAYQHAWKNFGNAVDWMAFIDGDEFLFPTHQRSMQDALQPYGNKPISALGVYWKCYGSNGHVADPSGLLLENYPRHSRTDFEPNRHIKSILKGRSNANPNRSHLFETEHGTFDESMRPITSGCMLDYAPSYDSFRINHYVVQSRDFFFKIKQGMGAADLPQGVRRQDEFFTTHDRNEDDDGVSLKFLPVLKEKTAELSQFLKDIAVTLPANTRLPRPVVQNYEIVEAIPPGNYNFTGDSVGLKEIVAHIPIEKSKNINILDIGFGLGDLGRIVKSNPATSHWHIDGIDGFLDACCNVELFQKRLYRNIWHGLALDIPADVLQSYDLICLFDVIEHLDVELAKQLLADLLGALGPNSRLVLSTPLFFWPQSQQHEGDLEEHKIGVPAASLLGLSPLMFHIHPKFLVGTFVFSNQSIAHLGNFAPVADKGFDLDAGFRHLHSLGIKADGVLTFVKQSAPSPISVTEQPHVR